MSRDAFAGRIIENRNGAEQVTVVNANMATVTAPEDDPVSIEMDLSGQDQDVSPLSEKEIELLELYDRLQEIELQTSLLRSRPVITEGNTICIEAQLLLSVEE
jgi:hypothetical protein